MPDFPVRRPHPHFDSAGVAAGRVLLAMAAFHRRLLQSLGSGFVEGLRPEPGQSLWFDVPRPRNYLNHSNFSIWFVFFPLIFFSPTSCVIPECHGQSFTAGVIENFLPANIPKFSGRYLLQPIYLSRMLAVGWNPCDCVTLFKPRPSRDDICSNESERSYPSTMERNSSLKQHQNGLNR